MLKREKAALLVWQESMMQGDLMASTLPLATSASPLGLPPQHHVKHQGLPAAAFNLASLPDNTTH